MALSITGKHGIIAGPKRVHRTVYSIPNNKSSYGLTVMMKQASISLSTTGEYGALPLSQCAWFYATGNILATTCSPYSLPLELLKYLL